MDTIIQSHKREKGQGFTEFAISMVVLLILLAGIVDLGRMFMVYVALREAAQEGASYGAICPDSFAIETRVRKSSTAPLDLSASEIRVNSSVLAQPGTELLVEVSYLDFPMSMPFIGTFLGSQTIDITADARDVVLQHACP